MSWFKGFFSELWWLWSKWRSDWRTMALISKGIRVEDPPFLWQLKEWNLCAYVCKSGCSCREKNIVQLEVGPGPKSSDALKLKLCSRGCIDALCKVSLWCIPNPAVALNLQTAGPLCSNLGWPLFLTWCWGRDPSDRARVVGEYMNYWRQFKKQRNQLWKRQVPGQDPGGSMLPMDLKSRLQRRQKSNLSVLRCLD